MLGLPTQRKKQANELSFSAPALTNNPVVAQKARPIIGVLGAKGGVGATTCAINLALACTQAAGKCVLVDADLQQPDIQASLDLYCNYSLLDLVNRSQPADASVLDTCTVALHESAFYCRLLAPPRTGEGALRTNLTDVTFLLEQLNAASPCWVIDLPRHLDKHLVTLMDLCDQILLVFEPSLAAFNSAQRWSAVFDQLSYDRRKIFPVINRSGGRTKVVEEQFNKVLGNDEFCRIPNAYALVEKCAAAGEPVLVKHAKEPYAQAIKQLTQETLRRCQIVNNQEKH